MVVVGIKDAPSTKQIQILRESVFKSGMRIQELQEIDDTCINLINVMTTSLEESYPEQYFKALDALQQADSSSECGGM